MFWLCATLLSEKLKNRVDRSMDHASWATPSVLAPTWTTRIGGGPKQLRMVATALVGVVPLLGPSYERFRLRERVDFGRFGRVW